MTWRVPLRGERKLRPYLRAQFDEWGAMFSPDGRFLAFASDESGRPQVDGRSFLLLKGTGGEATVTELQIVLDWFAGLSAGPPGRP